MNFFVFRNYTVEQFFAGLDASFSGYGDISSKIADTDAYIWFYLAPPNFSNATASDEISDYFNKFLLTAEGLPANKFIFAFTLAPLACINWEDSDYSYSSAIHQYNESLREAALKYSNIRIIDFSEFTRNIRSEDLIDWKYYYISQILLNPKLALSFKNWFLKKSEEIQSIRKKCLVLDLDNTLWGGIIGEDGIEGIQLGNTYPGNAFYDFQKALLEASARGVVLAICSKNNLSDIEVLWDKHPNLLLKREHFSCLRINWNDKASNLKEIANELNIGTDSLVMLDDNPAERELIKLMLPEVEVPDFPSQPYRLASFFREVYEKYFLVYQLTREDRDKAKLYRDNSERQSFRGNFASMQEYIAGLNIHVSLESANEFNIPRIAQMTQKTNQFNLTTRRYSESDIKRFVDEGNYVFCASVSDRFGDNGITAVCIALVHTDGITADIDSLMLSCRILGKGIEKQFLDMVIDSLKSKGIIHLYSLYLPSQKNMQTENFYDSCGFQLVESSQAMKKYYLNIV